MGNYLQREEKMQCWEVYYAKKLFDEETERERASMLICLDLLCGYLSFLTTRTFWTLSNFLLFPSVAIETNTWKWFYRGSLCELIPDNETTEGAWSLSYIQAIVLWECGHWPCDESPLFHEPDCKMACSKNSTTQALQPEAMTLQTLHTKYILIKGVEIRPSQSNTST